MKLVIADRSYSLIDSLQKATLADLYELKVKTGVGMKTLKSSLDKMSTLTDPEAFLDDEDILRGMNALVWLCRRRAGETLTVEQANDFPLSDLRFEADETDEDTASAADPQ